jgi:hypothetical protein
MAKNEELKMVEFSPSEIRTLITQSILLDKVI